jgi:hypothetical protein
MGGKGKSNSKTTVFIKNQTLIDALQKLDEKTLTLDIVIPLLLKLGFLAADYYGGRYESGKDIICYKKGSFNEDLITVIQVKKIKQSSSASEPKNISEIITQLSQAAENDIPLKDGTKRRPNEVVFITPTPINTRSLEMRFKEYSALRDKNLKIFGGEDLANLAEEFLGGICMSLIAGGDKIAAVTAESLDNSALLQAINSDARRKLQDFFLDLDLLLGKPYMRTLFNSEIQHYKSSITVNEESWKKIKALNLRLLKISLGFLESTPREIEKRYRDKIKTYRASIQSIELRKRNNREVKKTLAEIDNEIRKFETIHAAKQKRRKALSSSLEDIKEKKRKSGNRNTDFSKYQSEQIRIQDELDSLGICDVATEDLYIIKNIIQRTVHDLNETPNEKTLGKWREKLKQSAKEIGSSNTSSLNDLVSRILNLNEINRDYEENLKKFDSFDPEKPYSFEIEPGNLGQWLEDRKSRLKNFAKHTFERSIKAEELRDFLSLTNEVDDILRYVYEIPELFNQLLQIGRGSSLINTMRFRVPFSDIVNTGNNLLVLGDAGSGKTTCLQMHALTGLSSDRSGTKPVVFIPLGKMVAFYPPSNDKKDSIECLINAMVEYFKATRMSDIDSRGLIRTFDSGATFLFDGIDEAIRSAPRLPDVLKEFVVKFPKVQVVASSRFMGGTLTELGFLVVNLLPFDDAQQEEFIKKWLKGSEDVSVNLLHHLESNPSIKEIVRNPLLATVLCELAKSNQELPITEIQLYDDRFNLLTGRYDKFKEIVVRVRQRQDDLRVISQRIAWGLHKAGTREYSDDDFLKRIMLDLRFREDRFDNCIRELKFFSEILVPMDDPGSFGFGHLRFQEHLVAHEMLLQQWDCILPLFDDDWWTAPLFFYLCAHRDLRGFLTYFKMNVPISSSRFRRLRTLVSRLPGDIRVDSGKWLGLEDSQPSYAVFDAITDGHKDYSDDAIELQQKIEQDEMQSILRR